MADSPTSSYVSPVPLPALDATPPEVHRGIYGMPVFLTVPTPDLAASADSWIRGLGSIDLFSVPGQVTHLRRWAFQDVLLVPGEQPGAAPPSTTSFACVLSQLEEVRAACEELLPGCSSGPHSMPWNSVEMRVVTPENTRVVMTAARPLDPDSAQAQFVRDMGIELPEP